MKTFILVCVCLMGESYGAEDPDGVGAFAYNGPSGRYPYGGNLQGFNAFAGGPGYQGFPGYQGYQGPIYPGLGYQGQGFPGLDMSSFGPNSAYAGAAIGPDFMHQMASINPSNPSNPNVNKFNNLGSQPTGFKSVSSSSFASSHTDGSGRKTESRRAETTVNNNGVVTRYKVEN